MVLQRSPQANVLTPTDWWRWGIVVIAEEYALRIKGLREAFIKS